MTSTYDDVLRGVRRHVCLLGVVVDKVRVVRGLAVGRSWMR